MAGREAALPGQDAAQEDADQREHVADSVAAKWDVIAEICGGACGACGSKSNDAPPCLGEQADPVLRDRFLRGVLMNLSEAVVAIDARGTILFFSPGSERLLGYGSGEVVGRNVGVLMPRDEAGRHDGHILRYLSTGQSGIIGRTRQVTAVAKSGEGIEVDLRVVPFELGAAHLFIGTMRDVRERLERERRLEAAQEQLRRALNAERAANQAKSEFLANMNHELRTPLNAIIGMTDAILQGYCGALPDKQREYLRDIHAAGEHLRNLIGEILDLSKIESGKFTLLFEVCAPATLARDCVRMVDSLARGAGLSLETDVAEGLGDLVIDTRVVKQAILNLLSNAIKFTPFGGKVALSIAAGTLGGVTIEVADTGIGMSPDEIATAMSVFGQVESVMNRKHSGTGLGLPLARAFVELHGGSLRIESAPHAGTRVILDLPPRCVA